MDLPNHKTRPKTVRTSPITTSRFIIQLTPTSHAEPNATPCTPTVNYTPKPTHTTNHPQQRQHLTPYLDGQQQNGDVATHTTPTNVAKMVGGSKPTCRQRLRQYPTNKLAQARVPGKTLVGGEGSHKRPNPTTNYALVLTTPFSVIEYVYGFDSTFLFTYPSTYSLFIKRDVCSLLFFNLVWISRDVIGLSVIKCNT